MKCSTGKRCFEDGIVALDALIQNHIINDYASKEGPINIYQCDLCGSWHFTSKGPRHEALADPETQERIRKERRANYWERKLK